MIRSIVGYVSNLDLRFYCSAACAGTDDLDPVFAGEQWDSIPSCSCGKQPEGLVDFSALPLRARRLFIDRPVHRLAQ
jgi:hypothetical protein